MMSADDGAQTQLHCLLDDEAPQHSGEYYSQNSILYPNKANRAGGWPMRSPNPQVYDDQLAQGLYEASRQLVRYADAHGSLARHYLKRPELTSTEISFLLGHEDPSSFSRAFTAWTGTTPEQLRAGA
jgi:hypothetical protein